MPRRPSRRSPGEGAVYKRVRDGRETWVGALVVAYDPITGSIKRRTKTLPTKREAQAWLAAQQAALDAGARLGENPTFRQVYDDWLAAGRELRRWQPATVASYELAVGKVLPYLGHTAVRDIDANMVERALLKLARAGASSSMLKRVHSHVGMVMRRAERQRLVLRNPVQDVEVPSAPEPTVQRWSEAEVGRVVRACLSEDTLVARYVLVALGTGMRTEELLGLGWSSVDLEQRTVTVERVATNVSGHSHLRAGGKTDAAYRVIPIDDLTLGALARQRDTVTTLRGARAHLDAKLVAAGRPPLGWADNDLVFPSSVGTVLQRSVLRRWFNQLQERTKVTRIKLYATRSTHGSLLADAGVNLHALAERLGHTDPRFTARVYLRGSTSAHRGVADRIGEILGSSSVADERLSSVPGGHEEADDEVEGEAETRQESTN